VQGTGLCAALRPRLGVDVGLDLGQRPVGVIGRQIPVPELLEEHDRVGAAHLRAAHLAGELVRLGVAVAEHERRAGQDEQLIGGPAVACQARLDVTVEALPLFEPAVAREDPVGVAGRELTPGVGVAGLQQDGSALRQRGDRELPGDVDVAPMEGERPRPGTP
jgi:hypothetical protein